jgi:glycerate kinase
MASAKPNRGASIPFPRVLIVPDKFKGTLSAEEAARAIGRGIGRAWPGVKSTILGLTDGGEGFVEMMVRETGGRVRSMRTIDAAWRPCTGEWGAVGKKETAFIGLTSASGIAQLPGHLRNPEKTTNLGTGLLLAEALRAGCREIVVGIGGSATTEGGISLASVLGYRFLDKHGADIPLDGGGLARLARIEAPAKMPKARFTVATDVDNPLYGAKGAARQFAAQKGADAAMIARLETSLRRLARIVRRDLGKDLAQEPGAGAAGGCGYGLMVFFNAKRQDGFQLARRILKLDALIREHDLVITGEGCLDRTSLLGKGPAQLAQLARKLKKPAWALCGRVALPAGSKLFTRAAGLSTPENPGPPLESITRAQHEKNLETLAYDMARSG